MKNENYMMSPESGVVFRILMSMSADELRLLFSEESFIQNDPETKKLAQELVDAAQAKQN